MKFMLVLCLLVSTLAHAVNCSPEEEKKLQEFQDLLKKDKSGVLTKQIKITELKLATIIQNKDTKNIESFIKEETQNLAVSDSEKFREELKAFYKKYRKINNESQLNAIVNSKLNEFKNANYNIKSRRMDNEDLSAFMFAHRHVAQNSPFDEFDEAAAWSVQYMNSMLSKDQKGSEAYNLRQMSVNAAHAQGGASGKLNLLVEQQDAARLQQLIKSMPAFERCLKKNETCDVTGDQQEVKKLAQQVKKLHRHVRREAPHDISCMFTSSEYVMNGRSEYKSSHVANPLPFHKSKAHLQNFFDGITSSYFGIDTDEKLVGCCEVRATVFQHQITDHFVVRPWHSDSVAKLNEVRTQMQKMHDKYQVPLAQEVQRRVLDLAQQNPNPKTNPKAAEILKSWIKLQKRGDRAKTEFYFDLSSMSHDILEAEAEVKANAPKFPSPFLQYQAKHWDKVKEIVPSKFSMSTQKMKDEDFEGAAMIYRMLNTMIVVDKDKKMRPCNTGRLF